MGHLSAESIGRSIETEPREECYFLRIPLEIRDEIYRMLVTTPYCTHLTSTGTSLEFQLSRKIILVNKQVFMEAIRVFLEENDFIILKTTGLDLVPEDIPAFKFLTENKVTKPVLRVEVELVEESHRRHGIPSNTLITTSEGLQPIITALWQLKGMVLRSNMTGSIFMPLHPSDLIISLSFNGKSAIHFEDLKNLVLKPWELLHGVRNLSLTGDIGDVMYHQLQRSMLEGPFRADVATTLAKYHSMGQDELALKNYIAARRWWTLYEDYCRHLTNLRSDPLVKLGMGTDANNSLWDQLWIQFKRTYFEGKLGTTISYVRELRYREAALVALKDHDVRMLPFDVFFTMNPLLRAKFYLCEALAHTALGEIEEGMKCLVSAARMLRRSAASCTRTMTLQMIYDNLEISVNKELENLTSPFRCNIPVTMVENPSVDGQADMGNLSFWEWLDLQEE
jgi:hypothetical protein